MKNLILGMSLLLASAVAFAGQVQLDWVNPTERMDNAPLLPEDIGGNRVYHKGGALIVDTMDSLATSITIDLPNGNSYDLVVTTYDVDGRESEPSLTVNVALDHANPKSPTSVTATVL